jgi:XTP/dITP diphosphohydrolase
MDTNTKTLLIATANRGKAEEIKKIFAGTEFTLKFLYDFPESRNLRLVENAKSFEGNALIKAIVAGDFLNLVTLADDSGLCIEALGGQPGVYSARYSGQGTDESNNLKVLTELQGVPAEQRTCHYNCTVAIYDPRTKFVETVVGTWAGRVATAPRGTKSFGYAPLFLTQASNYQQTGAELEPEQVIVMNHRGQAFRAALAVLRSQLFFDAPARSSK